MEVDMPSSGYVEVPPPTPANTPTFDASSPTPTLYGLIRDQFKLRRVCTDTSAHANHHGSGPPSKKRPHAALDGSASLDDEGGDADADSEGSSDCAFANSRRSPPMYSNAPDLVVERVHGGSSDREPPRGAPGKHPPTATGALSPWPSAARSSASPTLTAGAAGAVDVSMLASQHADHEFDKRRRTDETAPSSTACRDFGGTTRVTSPSTTVTFPPTIPSAATSATTPTQQGAQQRISLRAVEARIDHALAETTIKTEKLRRGMLVVLQATAAAARRAQIHTAAQAAEVVAAHTESNTLALHPTQTPTMCLLPGAIKAEPVAEITKEVFDVFARSPRSPEEQLDLQSTLAAHRQTSGSQLGAAMTAVATGRNHIKWCKERETGLKAAQAALRAIRKNGAELEARLVQHHTYRAQVLQLVMHALASSADPFDAGIGADAGADVGADVGADADADGGAVPEELTFGSGMSARLQSISSSASTTTSPMDDAPADVVAASPRTLHPLVVSSTTGANPAHLLAAAPNPTISVNSDDGNESCSDADDFARSAPSSPLAEDSQLSIIATPEMLSSSPEEWKAVWRRVSPNLSPEEQQRAKALRRRSLSCLYAKRARQKRASAMSDLMNSNTVLATQNVLLREPILLNGATDAAAAAGTLEPSSSFGETGGTWPLAAAAMHALGQDFSHAVAEAQHPQTEPRRQQPQLPVERIC